MKSHQLLRVSSPMGERFYKDGRRISFEDYRLAKIFKRLDCLITTSQRTPAGITYRHFTTATDLKP